MPFQIDGFLYPDTDVPVQLERLADRVDFLARLCAAWDFGILPDRQTVEAIQSPEWREAVESCQLLTSPSYHLLRQWHNLAPRPYLGQKLPHIRNDPNLAFV
jgi:hypothetical protein